jgi:hypothetical protein
MKVLELFENEELLLLLKKKIYNVQQTQAFSVSVSEIYRIVYIPLKGLNSRKLEQAGGEGEVKS